jgi:hypothetical protein
MTECHTSRRTAMNEAINLIDVSVVNANETIVP